MHAEGKWSALRVSPVLAAGVLLLAVAGCSGGGSAPRGELRVVAGTPSGGSSGSGETSPFSDPTGIAVATSGDLLLSNSGNHTVEVIAPGGQVHTLAGLAGAPGSADGEGPSARFDGPGGLALDAAGNVYVADFGNATIRVITPSGTVSTLAGAAGAPGSADGAGSAARFDGPVGVAVDGAGNVYVADSGNDTIRVVTPAGAVSTLAGTAGAAGDTDGTGPAARFDAPSGLAVDPAGNVYVADFGNGTIRKITPSGLVSTLAGSAGTTGHADGSGDAARFLFPSCVTLDAAGDLLVADFGNGTVRRITPLGAVTTVVGVAGRAETTVGALPASLYRPACVAADARSGALFLTVPDAVLEVTF